VFAVFAAVVAPGLLWNAAFHAGASAVYRSRSPGLITAAVIFLPLFATLSAAAIGDGALSTDGWLLAVVIAAAVHAAEVWTNVVRERGEVPHG
jgi:hypothetical protein